MAKKKTSRKTPAAAKGSTAKKATKKGTTSKKKVSRKKPAAKKTASKKAAAKKTASKKTTAKKTTAKKAPQRKKAAQKKKATTTRKRASKKASVTRKVEDDVVASIDVEVPTAPVSDEQATATVTDVPSIPDPQPAAVEDVTEVAVEEPEIAPAPTASETPIEATVEVAAPSMIADELDWLDAAESDAIDLAPLDEPAAAPVPEISGLAAFDEPEVEGLDAFSEQLDQPDVAPAPRRAGGEDGGGQVLIGAAERGETDLMRTLLGVGTPSDARDQRPGTVGWTPLMLAVAAGHGDVVDLLLAAGADVDTTDDPDAAHFAQVRAMAMTLSPPQIAAEGLPLGRTALHLATAHGQVVIARKLIEAGAPHDVEDHGGSRPLMIASEIGELDLVRLLAKHGAHHDARDVRGCGALERAAMMGHSAVVAALLDGDAVVDSRDVEGRTPLMYAVGAAHFDAARVLLEGGADPVAEATSGFGVLCAAVCARGFFPDENGELVVRSFPEEDVLPIVELLSRWGADDALDSTGLRPSHRAEGLGYARLMGVLQGLGADGHRAVG